MEPRVTLTLATQAALRRRRRAWRSTKTAAAAEVAASTVGVHARMSVVCDVRFDALSWELSVDFKG